MLEVIRKMQNVEISINSADEIFITLTTRQERKIMIRVSPNPSEEKMTIVSGNGWGRLEPWSVNGRPAIRVLPQ